MSVASEKSHANNCLQSQRAILEFEFSWTILSYTKITFIDIFDIGSDRTVVK